MVDQVKREYGAQIEWLPFLLRPDMPPEGNAVPASVKARAAQSGDRLRHMAESQGLPFVRSSWVPNPRLAHESTLYAEEQGRGEEFHRIVFRKYYGEEENISEWNVLRAAAAEAGLDADALQRAVQSGVYHERFEQQIADARDIGVNSVPTYVLNDRYAIVGAQPFAVFKQVIARISASPQASRHDEDTG